MLLFELLNGKTECATCNGKFVKIRFSKITQKHVVLGFNFYYRYKIYFFQEKNLGGRGCPCENIKPTLDHFWAGVHGKACWLTAYLP